MLGLNEVLRALVSYFEGLTGGGNGLSLPTLRRDACRSTTRWALVAAAVTALTYLIVTSRFGLRLMTIREDEVAAEAMGIDTFRHKLYAFLLSAVGPGIVGGLAARDQGYIEPISVFPLVMTITMIVMVLFGGKGTVWGPVLGAVVALRLPGGRVGALPLPPPAPVRRHHRGGGAADAARGPRAAPAEVPPAADDLIVADPARSRA